MRWSFLIAITYINCVSEIPDEFSTAITRMPRTGQAVKEMLLELSQTDETIIPPYGVEKIQRTIEEIREHHSEVTRLTQSVEAEVCAHYSCVLHQQFSAPGAICSI